MIEPKDPYDNRLNNFMNSPVFYGIGSILVIVMVGSGWMDGWYGLVLLGVAAYGTWRWYQKRKSNS
jgi:uncharacterized membrane protein